MSLNIAEPTRRAALATLYPAGLVATTALIVPLHASSLAAAAEKAEEQGSEEVSATEDLMREHGVLRRVLIVYRELAGRLRAGKTAIDPAALAEAAKLFHDFGEDYHERILEEQYVFAELQKSATPHAGLIETLLAQHRRGREITGYIVAAAERGRIGAAEAEPLANTLDAMTRMYEAHATFEDTIVFPAWKQSQSPARLEDLAERFEEIEHEKFGKDGFDDALARVARVEQTLGLANLADYTAPPPPALP